MKAKIQTAIKLAIAVIILFTASCASQKKVAPVVEQPVVDEQKVYMQEMYEELLQELSQEAEVAIVEDSVKVIFVSGILFKVNASVINSESHQYFQRFSNVLNKYTKTTILIAGHADNTGDAKKNIELSQQRADNAKELLQTFDVDAERIYTLGHGSVLPVDNNNTAQGRAKNRRIEFIILFNCVK